MSVLNISVSFLLDQLGFNILVFKLNVSVLLDIIISRGFQESHNAYICKPTFQICTNVTVLYKYMFDIFSGDWYLSLRLLAHACGT